MRVAALDHTVALPQVVLAVVEPEHDLTVEHGHEVEGVGRVHARSFRLFVREADPTVASAASAGGGGMVMIRTDNPPDGGSRSNAPSGSLPSAAVRGGPSSQSMSLTPTPSDVATVCGGVPSERKTACPSGV